MRLVHPIPREKWIVRVGSGGEVLGRRKSPKRGRVVDAFEQLVSLWRLAGHANFSFEVALTQEEEVRRHEHGRVRRRKGWVIVERRLVDVVETHAFDTADDYRALIARSLPARFTTAELAGNLEVRRDLAQQIGYLLRKANLVVTDGKRGNALVYVNPWSA